MTPAEKYCPKCDTTKPASEFGKSKQTRDGLFGWCRDCKRAGDRRSHADHQEARTQKMRERYHANPEPQRERSRARAAADPQANRDRAAAWNLANRDRRGEIYRASARRRHAANPEVFRERWRRRNALVRKGVEVFDFGPGELAGKLAYWGGRCRWCRVREADCWDHVKPLAAGGPHVLSNLAPACTPCNATKRHVWPLVAVLALARRLRELAAADPDALR